MAKRVIRLASFGRRFGDSALGLVVCEHVDKIALMEPGVKVIEKDMDDASIWFTLQLPDGGKPVEEIVRGYKIGCWRIAREYGLISPDDKSPIFAQGEASGT